MRKIAVIGGTGRWGQNICQTLRDLRVSPVIFGSTNGKPEQILEVTRTWGVDAAVICSPADTHHPLAALMLDERLPVFIEKPLCLNTVNAEDLVTRATLAKVPCMVDHTHLFNAAWVRFKRELENAKPPYRWVHSKGGGPGPIRPDCSALWDYGSHDASLLIDLLGTPDWWMAQQVSPGRFSCEIGFAKTTAQMEVGSSFARKTRQMTVRDSAQRLYRFDDVSRLVTLDDRLVYDYGEALDKGEAQPPLRVALTLFLDAIEGKPEALADPRLGLDLGVQVVKLLEHLEGLARGA